MFRIDTTVAPRVRNREFFGTGGLGNWWYSYKVPERFKLLNAFNFDWADPGHLFDGFYAKFKKEIDILRWVNFKNTSFKYNKKYYVNQCCGLINSDEGGNKMIPTD